MPGLCKSCRKWPPRPRNIHCDHCLAEFRRRPDFSEDQIAAAARQHQAERSKPAPAMGYTVRKVAKSG